MKLLTPLLNSLNLWRVDSGESAPLPPKPPIPTTSRLQRWGFAITITAIFSLLATTLWITLSSNDQPGGNVKEVLATSEPIINEPILPIPLSVDIDADKAALGKQLFHDPRLSHNDTLACASCHNLAVNGADQQRVSLGVEGRPGNINTPTVFNSSNNFALFWDGRAATLEEQIDGPVHNVNEMASGWPEIIKKLNRDEQFKQDFKHSYPDGLTVANIKDAIAEFERGLTTPNARFDRYLRGDQTAINEQELHGYQLFKNYGCIACHQGMNVGGNMYQKLGVMRDYFKDRGHITQVDYGRFNVTGNEQDRHYFRVASLRNVALTAPYFHDGSAKTLEQAIKVMAKYQLGRTIPPEDIRDIVAFLKTLTGEYRGAPL